MKSFAVLPMLLQLIFISRTSTKPVIDASNEVNDISISSFETAILRCCGSVEDNTGYRLVSGLDHILSEYPSIQYLTDIIDLSNIMN